MKYTGFINLGSRRTIIEFKLYAAPLDYIDKPSHPEIDRAHLIEKSVLLGKVVHTISHNALGMLQNGKVVTETLYKQKKSEKKSVSSDEDHIAQIIVAFKLNIFNLDEQFEIDA